MHPIAYSVRCGRTLGFNGGADIGFVRPDQLGENQVCILRKTKDTSEGER